MTSTTLIAFIFLVVSLFIAVAGYLIRVKKQLWMIAGYNADEVKDKDGLAEWVGTGILTMGGLDILVSLLLFVASSLIPILIGAFIVINLGGTIVMLIGVQRFMR